jgi:hypothetical protein
VGLADQAFADDGSLADPEQQRRLASLMGALTRELAVPVG